MDKNNFIFLILLLIFFILKNNKENMTNYNYKPLKYFASPQLLPKIEILNLPKVELDLTFKYCLNENYLFNDGKEIYQNSKNHFSNRVLIDGYRFGFSKILFTRSIFSWDKYNIKLELRIRNVSGKNSKIIDFIIPLILEDIRLKKSESECNNLDIDYFINNLINRDDEIPLFKCCKPIKGKVIKFNLNLISKILMNEKYFYNYKMDNFIDFFVTRPFKFDKIMGNNLLRKLIE